MYNTVIEILENLLENEANKASLDYVKNVVTTNNATINVMAGLGFKDGAEWIVEQLKKKLTSENIH